MRCTMRQGPDVYTVQLELELEGAVEPAVLEASLQAVIGRHASLRCGFRHEQLGGRCRWCCRGSRCRGG